MDRRGDDREDGRFAAALLFPSGRTRVFDLVTGAWFDVPVAFDPRAAHPRDTALFGLVDGPVFLGMAAGTAARLDAGGLTRFGGCQAGTARGV